MEPVDLAVTALHPSVDDPALHSMNFLNEVAQQYPDAVSLAAGRPYEEFFDSAVLHEHLDAFRRHLYDAGAPVNALRLSVSAVTPEQIDVGLDRLAALITDESAGAVGTAVSARAGP